MVVKDNSLIGASYSLGVAEQRLIFLAIIEAREQKQLIDARGVLQIKAKSYQEQFKVEKHTSYDALKSATSGLFDAHFEYEDIHEQTGKLARHVIRWVQKISYIDDAGMVELQFTDVVIPLITRLSERYTEYELKQVSALQSEYAIRLYELLIQWRGVGKVPPMSLEEFRSKVGVLDGSYKDVRDLKKRVLKLALKQINEHTDIIADYTQHKTGKSVTGLSFHFKKKSAAKKITADNDNGAAFPKLSTGQIATFSNKLARLPELGSNAPKGASTEVFAEIIAGELADKSKQVKYLPYLEKVGYKPAKAKA